MEKHCFLPAFNYFYFSSAFNLTIFTNLIINKFRLWNLTVLRHKKDFIREDYLKNKYWKKKTFLGASLVVQWLRPPLPMQRTQVWSLVRKNPHASEQLSPCTTNYWAHLPRSDCTTTGEATPQWNACTAMKSSSTSAHTATREGLHTATKRPSTINK